MFRSDPGELPVPVTKHVMHPRAYPSWLPTFLDSDDYWSNCPCACLTESNSQQQQCKYNQSKVPETHRRRYFCTECPQEGAICQERVIERHLKHRVLKVRKVQGVGFPVVKLTDMEPLLNVSHVLRLSSPQDATTYLRLKSSRQTAWPSHPDRLFCFECLSLAGTSDYRRYKFCSIKCAYTSADDPQTARSAMRRSELPRALSRPPASIPRLAPRPPRRSWLWRVVSCGCRSSSPSDRRACRFGPEAHDYGPGTVRFALPSDDEEEGEVPVAAMARAPVGRFREVRHHQEPRVRRKRASRAVPAVELLSDGLVSRSTRALAMAGTTPGGGAPRADGGTWRRRTISKTAAMEAWKEMRSNPRDTIWTE